MFLALFWVEFAVWEEWVLFSKTPFGYSICQAFSCMLEMLLSSVWSGSQLVDTDKGLLKLITFKLACQARLSKSEKIYFIAGYVRISWRCVSRQKKKTPSAQLCFFKVDRLADFFFNQRHMAPGGLWIFFISVKGIICCWLCARDRK